MHTQIEAVPDNITLAWTFRWLLSSTAMENILANEKKHNRCAKVTIPNAEEKDRLLKNDQ